MAGRPSFIPSRRSVSKREKVMGMNFGNVDNALTKRGIVFNVSKSATEDVTTLTLE